MARLAPIVEPLHLAFAGGFEDIGGARLVDDPDYAWLRSHHLRACARKRLESEAPDGWVLAGNVRRNGQFLLATADAALQVRVLRDGVDGHVPPAGGNIARRKYYSNLPGQLSLWKLDEDSASDPFHKLLVLWSELGEGEFSMRVVRPLEPGTYRRRFPVDLDLPLPRLRSDFEHLRFQVNDDEEDLEGDVADGELDENGF